MTYLLSFFPKDVIALFALYAAFMLAYFGLVENEKMGPTNKAIGFMFLACLIICLPAVYFLRHLV